MGDREVHKDLILGRSKKDPTASIKRRLKERTLPIVKGQEPGTSAPMRNVPGSSNYVYSKVKQPRSAKKQKEKINERVFKLAHVIKGWKWRRKKARTVLRKIVNKEWNSDSPVSRRPKVGARRHIDELSE